MARHRRPALAAAGALAALAALAFVLAVVAGAGCRRGNARGTVKVAAASDLARAFEELGPVFTRATGYEVVFTFGSSGLLAKQLGEGGPWDLFAAANAAYVDQVVAAGACDGATRALYARGRIVVWSRDGKVDSLAALADPRWRKIAIANPEHAPYGKAAKQALERTGTWDAVRGRLVYGENIRQTMQWAQDGSADVAITALSLATVTTGGHTLAIDQALYEPLDQQLVVCGRGPGAEGARAFAAFVNGPEGRAVMRRYGFLRPGE